MRNLLVLLLLIIGSTCEVRAQGEKSDPRVVMISLDGAADWIIDEFLEKEVLPKNGAFARMKEKGLWAREVISSPIAATAVAHTSLFTGTHPEKHGIVGNNFLIKEKPIRGLFGSSGFTAPIKSQTVWEHLKTEGKATTLINSVGADGSSDSRSGTNTIGYGRKMANSFLIKLHRGGNRHSTYTCFVPKKESTSFGFQLLGKERSFPLFAFSTSPDQGHITASPIIVDSDENPNNGHLGVLELNKWTPLEFDLEGQRVVSWSLLKDWNSDFSEAEIYFGPIGFNPISPIPLKKEMEDGVGFWPGEQDNRMLSQGKISEKMWWEQAIRLAEFYKQQILFNMARGDWDFLTGYFSLVDDVQHRFLLRSPRQSDYFQEGGQRKVRYDEYIARAYQTLDEMLLEIIDKLPKDANLMVVSDHGVAPVHSVFLINNFLRNSGYEVQGDSVEVRAYTTGPAAHIYINIKGRQDNGTVPKNKMRKYRKKLLKLFKSQLDPVTKEPIFPLVLSGKKINTIGLNFSGRSGDLFVSTRIGWSLSGKIVDDVPHILPNSFKKDSYYDLSAASQSFLSRGFMNETGLGVHGNLGSTREMQSILYGIGPDLRTKSLPTIRIIDIVPTILEVMKVSAINDAQGVNVLND